MNKKKLRNNFLYISVKYTFSKFNFIKYQINRNSQRDKIKTEKNSIKNN